MSNRVQIFEEWLAQLQGQLGKRFHPIPAEIAPAFEKQLRAFNRRKGELQKMILPGRSIEVYADFTDDPSCNAVAGIYKSVGLIAMNKGSIMLPVEMFFNMFSHPLVLPEIGWSKRERICPQHRAGLLTDYDDLVSRRLRTSSPWF
jgi:hypothetical protein